MAHTKGMKQPDQPLFASGHIPPSASAPSVAAKDFVYARAMGTQDNAALGYATGALDQWAGRIHAWATGATSDLPLLDGQADGKPRDVFFYVISGAKVRNPHAAQALLERLGVASPVPDNRQLF